MEFFGLASLAVVAGLLSFTSPCTLPLLPGYVSYVSGLSGQPASEERRSLETRRRTLTGAGLFVLGFSAVFTTLGATATALGLLLTQNQQIINQVGGSLIVVMGVAMTGLIRIPLLSRQYRFDLTRIARGPSGALPLGAAFAFAWTPCVGPVLASILAVAASTTTLATGTFLLLAYSFGLAAPFLALAAAMARGRVSVGWLQRHARHIEILGGLVLVALGIALLTGGWTALMSKMLAFYAHLGWPPL